MIAKLFFDKHGRQIRAGDVLFNPWDADEYHEVLADTDGNLYLGDFDSPLGKYRPNEFWEIADWRN